MQLSHLVAAALFAGGVHCSLQGLYAMSGVDAQLSLVDLETGSTSDVGSPLAAAGWKVEPCAPAAIHPTVKLYFTLARNEANATDAPWQLLRVSLGSGMVQDVLELPADFPRSLTACDHALSISEVGIEVYVSAATESRLLVADMDFQRRRSTMTANLDLSSIGLGRAVPAPCSSFTDIDGHGMLWHQLSEGVVGTDAKNGSVTHTVKHESGSLCPLQFWGERVYALSSDASGVRVASFDPSAPELEKAGSSISATPARKGNAAVLLWQEQGILFMSGTKLVTVDLQGNVTSTVEACEKEAADGVGCFSSIGYEPNVIAFV